ncbi:hypothetical protein D3C75_1373400 [compost metagenome]
MTGTTNCRNKSAYRNKPAKTTVAICKSDITPDGYIAAKVPAKMITADTMTVPIFFMAVRIAASAV